MIAGKCRASVAARPEDPERSWKSPVERVPKISSDLSPFPFHASSNTFKCYKGTSMKGEVALLLA